MADRAAREELRVLRPEMGTRPRVWYRNLARFDHCFIGGTVSRVHNGVRDCAEGATAQLRRNGEAIATAMTNAFGDFRFDRIEPDSGVYELYVVVDGRERRIRVELHKESIYVGEIVFE
jgi:hypothetical protein